MFRKRRARQLALLLLAPAVAAAAQERRAPAVTMDVDHYTIDAQVNPDTQSLAATVKVQFTPQENLSSASFELNNALNVARVVDDTGHQLPAARNQQDFTVTVDFPSPLPKGKAATLTFTYDGRLNGDQESPVYGINFAAIKKDHTFLLYPARWFPVSGYTTDRFSADTRVTVPAGFHVIASGDGQQDRVDGNKVVWSYHFKQRSFPGSIAVVQDEPVKVNSNGLTTTVYFREKKNLANSYGEQVGDIMAFLGGIYGLPPVANLTLIETDDGTPNGYAAPGLVFLSPKVITNPVSTRALVNACALQWWSALVSPITRNSFWLENGNARYAELLYIEHATGQGAYETDLRDTYVDALTVDSPPLSQAGRLEDYSPEYWALTAGKGAAVLNMLRSVMGDENFFKLLKSFTDQYSWKSVGTRAFEEMAEKISGDNLQGFFIQWIDSSGAPEFKLEYTVFRTAKGFRVMGKVSQDLDTFSMPVTLHIETEGNPEDKKIEVVGTSSEFSVDTFGKPKTISLDPKDTVLHYAPNIRVAVAIRRGQEFVQVGEYAEALKEYQKALEVHRNSSLAHYRVGELFLLQDNFQSAANEFREALNGDLDPKWTEVWSHINLGNIFDVTSQRERAVNEYQQAVRTRDDTQGAQQAAAKYLKTPYQRKRTVDE